MFDFRRITLFCLEKHVSKLKMTIFSKNLEGAMAFMAPLPTPMLICYNRIRNCRVKAQSELNISMICRGGADAEQNFSKSEWMWSQKTETPSISGSRISCIPAICIFS